MNLSLHADPELDAAFAAFERDAIALAMAEGRVRPLYRLVNVRGTVHELSINGGSLLRHVRETAYGSGDTRRI